MRADLEQELSHTLLVELLAYQFASPVRWIETQDVILGENDTERIVEIGPADTLGGMAKRTLATKYEGYDAARSVQRQILAYAKDAKEIYYDVDPVEEDSAPASGGGGGGGGPLHRTLPQERRLNRLHRLHRLPLLPQQVVEGEQDQRSRLMMFPSPLSMCCEPLSLRS